MAHLIYIRSTFKRTSLHAIAQLITESRAFSHGGPGPLETKMERELQASFYFNFCHGGPEFLDKKRGGGIKKTNSHGSPGIR